LPLNLGHGKTQRFLLRLFRAVHCGLQSFHQPVLPKGIRLV
jgi:hypothetical protein